MNADHHSLEDRFHWAMWMSNIFPPCNKDSEIRSRVNRSNVYSCNFSISRL